jgi:hypothetical protein
MKRRELIKMAGFGAAVAALARPAIAQSTPELASVYSGYWTFRVIDPTSDQIPPNESALIRAQAEINFETAPPRIEWDNGSGGISGLDLNPVTVKPSEVGEPASFYSVDTPDPPGWQPVSFYTASAPARRTPILPAGNTITTGI